MEYVKLKNIAKYPTGKLDSNAAVNDGKYPFFTCAQTAAAIDTYAYDGEYVLLGGNNANGNFPVFYYKGKFNAYQRTYLIQPTSDIIDTKYLYYLIRLKINQMRSNASGTATKFLTKPILDNINIEYRSIVDQRRIASILSGYDDLIENNNKRIQILEKMAENLYKEWFSYKKVKSSATHIHLGDVLQYTRGISYSSEEINNADGLNLINLKNIQSHGGFRRDGTKLYQGKYNKAQEVTRGDLIMGVTDMTQDRRTVGSVALIPSMKGISVISADLIKIDSEISNIFLYAMFRYGNVSKYIAQFANGANVLHLKPNDILKIKVFMPQRWAIEKYVFSAQLMFDQIAKLNETNDNLTKQRDMLLPRLMNGTLEI